MFSETECIERRDFTVLHKIVLDLVLKDLELELTASTAEIDALDSNERTPLSLAAERGDVQAVTLLLRFGANTRIGSNCGVSPLHAAACALEPDCMLLLLSHNADVNALTNWNQTPLHYAAAYNNDARHTQVLLDAGADADFRDRDGITALGWTAISDNTNVAMTLLEHGVDVNNSDNSGATALVQSVSANRYDILRALVERGASANVQLQHNENILHVIAKSADLQTMMLLGPLDFSMIDEVHRNEDGLRPIDVLKARVDISTELLQAFDNLTDGFEGLIGALGESDEDWEEVWQDASE